jgi:hypothetical protein
MENPMDNENKLAPLPVKEASIWGAFLYEGLSSSHLDNTKMKGWQNGFIELVSQMCDYLPLIHKALIPYELDKQDRPGVFEYEVISIFGEYLGDYLSTYNGELPPENKIKDVIQQLVDAFFEQVANPLK